MLVEDLPEQRQTLIEILSQYKPENVYNADETGLFFRMTPNQTLATKPVKGKKKDKERINYFTQPIQINSNHWLSESQQTLDASRMFGRKISVQNMKRTKKHG